MTTNSALGVSDPILEPQHVLDLCKRLLSASAEFPTLRHFALRSDDELCWNVLAAQRELNTEIPSLPVAGRGFADRRILRLQSGKRLIDEGVTDDPVAAGFTANRREWVWERSLVESYRDPNFVDCFKATEQPLKVSGKPWIGRLIDAKVKPLASCKSFHFMRNIALEVLPELLNDRIGLNVVELNWEDQERLWIERLYELFPPVARRFGPVEIATLPMNVFATTARAIEMLSANVKNNVTEAVLQHNVAKMTGETFTDPIEEVFAKQKLALYQCLKQRHRRTSFDELAVLKGCWKIDSPQDATIVKGLKRLQKALNEIPNCPVQLVISKNDRRTWLDK